VLFIAGLVGILIRNLRFICRIVVWTVWMIKDIILGPKIRLVLLIILILTMTIVSIHVMFWLLLDRLLIIYWIIKNILNSQL